MKDDNPFIWLRKYLPDLNDPKENQATETLASCLKFSDTIKQDFVAFLFGDVPIPFGLRESVNLTVATQVNIGKFGILDLHLSVPDKINIAVEVKVAAPENSKQLDNYREWLLS